MAVIQAYQAELTQQRIACRRLATQRAFHTPDLHAAATTLQQHLQQITLHPPTIPYLSNLTGDWISAAEATDPQYWADQLTHPVQFSQGLAQLRQEPDLILLEVSPGNTLSTLVQRQAPDRPVFATFNTPADTDEYAQLLTTLGQLWVARVTVDWDQFYAQEQRRRIPLPTYPFERQRYWVEPGTPTASVTQPQRPIRRPITEWSTAPSWCHRPLALASAIPEQHWLILLDDTGLGQALATQLRQAGQSVLTVQRGTTCQQHSAEHWSLHPTRAADYATLWQALPQQPDHIVHLWNLTETHTDTNLTDSFYSFIYLAQAIGQAASSVPATLHIIANHLVNVQGQDPIQPLKATLFGPARSLPHEYAQLHCRIIDLDWIDPTPVRIKTLVQELSTSSNPDAPIIAWRGLRRWQSCTVPIPLPTRDTAIRAGGTYLITGGLGGIGLSLAQHLAQYQTRLILWLSLIHI